MRKFMICLAAVALMLITGVCPAESEVPENVYQGELLNYSGPWAFHLPKAHLIYTTDAQLKALADDPEAKVDMKPFYAEKISLSEICEGARRSGARTLVLAFDHFFGQGDNKQETPRLLTPDSDEGIKAIASISKVAESYGLALETSFLTPLEIGRDYRKRTGESGMWLHFRKGVRDPETGAFSVQLWRNDKWENNKGAIQVEDAGVRVFAFKEKTVRGTMAIPDRVVDPNDIVEITDVAKVEEFRGMRVPYGYRIRVYGAGKADIGDLNRVLVVQQYRTPEMDYFSDSALPYLKKLIDRYMDAGVELNGLYSDEIHIQQDGLYHKHHENGEFPLRYVSPGLAKRYAALYGEEYRDLAKYMVYFTYGQEDTASDLTSRIGISHVFGSSPEDIRRTALFRARYYHLLQDGVTDLFAEAKRYAEERSGHRLEARNHATWAESPSCDRWNVPDNPNMHRCEYTSNFVWSNTVHQASCACYDYFKWGDFLTGNGTDSAEGGWIDDNYYSLALGCSLGVINDVPYAYSAAWGSPNAVLQRRNYLNEVYGIGSYQFNIVQNMQHRDVEVLMLYPLDLVAAEERFGSWMTQYGYANYISEAKLLEMGKVKDGAVEVGGRRFTTLVALFEPFPSEKLLGMMKDMVESGGKVVWSGPPPVLTMEGGDALADWKTLFAVYYVPDQTEGMMAPGMRIDFRGVFAGVESQTILTDFLVDRIYPVTPMEGATEAARAGDRIIGTYRPLFSGGSATFLGYRPRDDQSASLGYETRNWFEVLRALGVYPASGWFPGVNDNTESVSRNTDYLACRFPNGAVAVSPHFKRLQGEWNGGFMRNEEEDAKLFADNPLPSTRLSLKDFKVNGHSVSYEGDGAVAFRVDRVGNLRAFSGYGCSEISVDGKKTVFCDSAMGRISWAPIARERRVDGGAIMQIFLSGSGEVRIPVVRFPRNVQMFAEGPKPGSRGEPVTCEITETELVFQATPEISNRWLYVVPVDDDPKITYL